MQQATQILNETFGFDQFRPLQEEIIQNVLDKKDTQVIMPTGGGKSLCYQIPAMIFDNITIVVSPLISLMKDQVEQLVEYGIPAAYLNSMLTTTGYQQTLEKVRDGSLKLLYVAPETLAKPSITSMLEQVNPACLAVDEAHCISEWGHDFRPEYRKLREIRKKLSPDACIALTATATPHVRKDIINNLGLQDPKEFVASFDRPNLFLEVRTKTDPLRQTLDFLKSRKEDSGIIYCFSRRQVDELSDDLHHNGYSVRPYHAGLSEAERSRNQEDFIRDDVQIIVATIAFGMGIDKPNVRFVIHYDLPKNIEAYYQQIGRAGRDGLDSHCLLLFSYADIQKIKYIINQKSDEQEKRVANIHLNELIDFVESNLCRRIPLLNYFGETFEEAPCEKCDNCLKSEEDQQDLTVPAQKFLSCVVRTGQRFGATHITDILRGSENKKVKQRGHDKLSTHGIGQELTTLQWKQLSSLLLQQGYLQRDPQYGGLSLSKKAVELLKDESKFMGKLEEDRSTLDKNDSLEFDYDQELFQQLRWRRKKIADEQEIPPYAIFPDRTLMELSAYYPQSTEAMLQIHGIGTVKFEKYGKTFMKIIDRYCKRMGIEGRQRIPKRRSRSKSKSTKGKRRFQEVGEAFNAGASIPFLMKKYDVKQSTILRHITHYAQEGHRLREADVLSLTDIPEDRVDGVIQAFEQEESRMLRPVYEALDEEVSYEDLKVARLYYLIKSQDDDGK